jgi:hypothetical protein
MPSHDRAMANCREHEGLPGLVLTDLELDGVSVLAIPYGIALAELTTWSTLTFARTFGQARRDRGAAQLVASRLSELLGPSRDPHETYRTTGSDRARFNASAFFGDENWRSWTPNARVTTADFLQQHEPDVGAAFLQPDTAWGHDYEPVAFVAAKRRDDLEAALREGGYEVRQWRGLSELYLDPPVRPHVTLALT